MDIPGFPTSDAEPGVRVFGLVGQGTGTGGARPLRVAVLGPKVSNPGSQGSLAVNVLSRIRSVPDAGDKWGYGAPIHGITDAIVAACPDAELIGIGVAEAAAGATKGTKDFTFSGTATASGGIRIQAGGFEFLVAMPTGTTASQAAAAMAAAIGGLESAAANHTLLPCYATAAAAVVTVESKWKTEDANGIGVAVLIEGLTGLTVSPTEAVLASGAGAAQWDDAIEALLEDLRTYDYIIMATGVEATICTGDSALKNQLKLARRPDVFKLLKTIMGNVTSESSAHSLSSAWEEGTPVDETGAFGQAIWGSGQTAPPWIVAAAWAGHRFAAEMLRPNKNPAKWGGTPIPYLRVPLFASSFPTRAEIKAALNEGVVPLQYDVARNVPIVKRSITCKHSTGGINDYKARPTVVPVVTDYILVDLKSRLEAVYGEDFYIADDLANGRPPMDLAPNTVTASLFRKKLHGMLIDYQRAGYLEDVEGLLNALFTSRNADVSSRMDGDASYKVRKWLEQLGVIIREVGGAA